MLCDAPFLLYERHMKAFAHLICLLILVFATAPRANSEIPTIAGWYYNFDNGTCSIWRYEKDNIFVMLEDDWREEPRLTIQVSGIKRKPKAGQLVTIGGEVELTVSEGRKYDGTAGFGAPMPDGLVRWLSSQDHVPMTIGDQGPANVDLAGLPEAFSAYQACLETRAEIPEESLIHVGAKFTGLAQHTQVTALLSEMARQKPADFHFRLQVADDGQPSACETRESTGFEDFDVKLCGLLLQHGAFEPARTLTRKAVAASYQGVIDFK